MKKLVLLVGGEYREVNEQGHIKTPQLSGFSAQWIFKGGSSHHWHNRVTVTREQAFENPKLLIGCYGWDIDHGTTRRWGNRIQNAYLA